VFLSNAGSGLVAGFELVPGASSAGVAVSAKRCQRSIRAAPSSGPSVQANGNSAVAAAPQRSRVSVSRRFIIDINRIRRGIG
jgi:hypothetical protein